MAETTDTKVGQTKEEHQRLFYEWIASHSGTNSSLVTAKAYEDIKASLKGIPNHKPSRNLKKRLKRNNFKLISHEGLGLHDIVCVPADGTQIKKSKHGNVLFGSFKRVAKKEELFDIIWRNHVQDNHHAGYLKTYKRISEFYAQIPRATIQAFTRLCEVCSQRPTRRPPRPPSQPKLAGEPLNETSNEPANEPANESIDQPGGPPTNPAKTLSMLYKDLILAAGIAADQIPTPMEVVATVEEEVENDCLPVETGSTISLEAAKSCQLLQARDTTATERKEVSAVSEAHTHPPPSMTNVEVCRAMVPDDANHSGNVHGGTILKLIEEAGVIIAMRHCNKESDGPKKEPCWTGLARVERTDFLEPMFIGEIAKVHAKLSFASKHSLEVFVDVWAENLMKGTSRLTNRAHLWYVPLKINTQKIAEVPPLTYASPEQQQQGQLRYEAQKAARRQRKESVNNDQLYNVRPQSSHRASGFNQIEAHTVPYSQSTLIHYVHPSDCNQSGYASGGFTMKMMDNVAGITSYRHCRTNTVTASIEAVDFHEPVRLGHVMTFTGRLTFTSKRSLEVEVLVDAEDVREGKCFRACSAFFTFVSLDDERQVQPVPQLKPRGEDEEKRFEEGRYRYEEKKKLRQKLKAS